MQCARSGFSVFVQTGGIREEKGTPVPWVASSYMIPFAGEVESVSCRRSGSGPPKLERKDRGHLLPLVGRSALDEELCGISEACRFLEAEPLVSMLHTKVKTEKPDMETANARTRLEAVLQCLLEKTDVDREQMEEDSAKTVSDALSKDSSPTATGKRPSTRFSHHRRKKRKEADDGLAEGGQQKQNTYVIKLFDRSVDLAQFSENTPLYPICRAWMRNSPTVREQERSTSPILPSLPEDEEGVDGLNGKTQDVFKLPPPAASQTNARGEPVNLRIPPPLEPEEDTKAALAMFLPAEASESVPSMSTLIFKNMERWKKIRQRWKEASHKNQLRYTESMKILKEMYERQ